MQIKGLKGRPSRTRCSNWNLEVTEASFKHVSSASTHVMESFRLSPSFDSEFVHSGLGTNRVNFLTGPYVLAKRRNRSTFPAENRDAFGSRRIVIIVIPHLVSNKLRDMLSPFFSSLVTGSPHLGGIYLEDVLNSSSLSAFLSGRRAGG